MKKSALFMGAATALLSVNGAQAGSLYIANLNGTNSSPQTPSQFTGTGYFVLDNGDATGTYWFNHNIGSTLVGGAIQRANGSTKYNLPDPRSPGGPFQTIITNPAADKQLLLAGGIYMNFLTTTYPAGEIRGAFVPYTFAPQATTRAQSAVAKMLDQSAGNYLDLDNVLVATARSTPAAQADAFGQLSGRTLYAQSVEILDSFAGLQDSVIAHATEVRPAVEGFTVFFKGGYAFGKRDTTMAQEGSKVKRPFAVGGIDYGLNEAVKVGIAVGFADGKDTFKSGLGTTDVTTTAGLAYIASTSDRLILQAVAGYGISKIETRRNIAFLSRTASSNHDGSGWSLAAKVAVPFHLNADMTLAPYALIDTQNAHVDAYAETGANSVGLMVDAYRDKDVAVETGAMFRAPVGPNFTARLEAGWRQSLDKGGENVLASLTGSPVKFSTDILGRSPGAAHIGASFATTFNGLLDGEAGYRGYISGRATINVLEARITFHL